MQVIGSGTLDANYKKSLQNLTNTMQHLASGKSLTNPSDNPADLAISEAMALQISGDTAGDNNMSNANNFINTANSYLQSANDMVGQMSNLAVQMNDGTLNATDQQAITAEYGNLNTEVNNVYSNAQFNGQPIFGQQVTLATDTNGGQFTIAMGNAPAGILNPLTPGNASAALGQLQNASGFISSQQAALGAAQSQLEYRQTNLETNIVNTQASNSTISDLDMAQGSMNLAQNQILNQASIAMLAHSNLNLRNTVNLLQ